MTSLTDLTAKREQRPGKTATDADLPLSMPGMDRPNIVEMVSICQQIHLGVTTCEDSDSPDHTTLRDLDARMSALLVPA